MNYYKERIKSDQNITFWIKKEDYMKLKDVAWQKRCSMSEFIRANLIPIIEDEYQEPQK